MRAPYCKQPACKLMSFPNRWGRSEEFITKHMLGASLNNMQQVSALRAFRRVGASQQTGKKHMRHCSPKALHRGVTCSKHSSGDGNLENTDPSSNCAEHSWQRWRAALLYPSWRWDRKSKKWVGWKVINAKKKGVVRKKKRETGKKGDTGHHGLFLRGFWAPAGVHKFASSMLDCESNYSMPWHVGVTQTPGQ